MGVYCVVVTFEVRREHRECFQKRVARQATDSLAREPGCSVFDVWIAANSPDEVYLYEVYEDRAAFVAHLTSPHFLAFDAEVAPMVWNKTVAVYDRQLAAG